MHAVGESEHSKLSGLVHQLKCHQSAWLVVILVIAVCIRVLNINQFPPFIDEVGHIDLAKHYDYYPLYQRVAQGFKIFGHVLIYPTAQWGPFSLTATRLLVALSGCITTLGIFLITQDLGGRVPALLAGLMWAAMPMITFHDRLALFDPLVSFLMVWAILLLISSMKRRNWIPSLMAGFLLGLAIITKIYAVVGVFWFLSIGFIYFDIKTKSGYLKIFVPVMIGVIVPVVTVLASVIPDFDSFLQSTIVDVSQFVGTSGDLESRLILLMNNSTELIGWFTAYNSAYFTAFSLVIVISVAVRPSRIKIGLLLAFLFSLLASVLVYRVFFSRYLPPILIPFVVLAGIVTADWFELFSLGLHRRIHSMWVGAAGSILVSVLLVSSIPTWISTDLALLTNPLEAKIPPVDQVQYLNGWPSGNGVADTVLFLNETAKVSSRKIVVFTAGFGTHGFWSFPMLMGGNPNIDFRRVGSYGISSRQDLVEMANSALTQRALILLEPPIYVLRPDLYNLISPQPSFLFEFRRPRSDGGFQLYELDSNTIINFP